MIVKSREAQDHLKDLEETFQLLRRYNLKLNPLKCTFGVSSGKFLGYMISPRGIEANPDQVQALLNLRTPSSVKDIQKLTGMAAALGRFIARSSDKCKPFFKALQKSRRGQWDEECGKAFEDLKQYVRNMPLLTAPEPGDVLILYLAVSDYAVSSVLLREEGKEQRPIFFISKSLLDAETRYLLLEKVVLALFISSIKLRYYFLAHTIIVRTTFPIKAILQRADFTGRMTKWSLKLNEFDIKYEPRMAIKGQVWADFLAEFTGSPTERNRLDSDKETEVWKLFVDGASNSKGSGVGLALFGPGGIMIETASRLGFNATNNEAEYEALLAGLKLAKSLGACPLKVFCDSLLVANQLSGDYTANDDRMQRYKEKVLALLEDFEERPMVEQIPREYNSHSDALAKLASAIEVPWKRTIQIDSIPSSSITELSVNEIVVRSPSWMDPIISYLRDDLLPEDRQEARKIRIKSARFYLSPPPERELYRRSFTGPYLKCLHPEEVEDFLSEAHEGECGSHTGGRSLVYRAITQGFWWPKMQEDAKAYVKRCEKCQRFSPLIKQPARDLTVLTNPWPFAQWGMDIVGPMPKASGGRRFMIVATDYFTKWVEAVPLVRIRDTEVIKFVHQNILTRFGIPHALITDNGTQFESSKFRDFCQQHGIKNFYSTPAYPQSNGQAEKTNRTILDGIKKRLENAKGRWAEELPSVLWAYRTTPRVSTGETPFALTFGVEAVIPLEINHPTLRTRVFSTEQNDQNIARELDLLEEKRDHVMIKLASYQQQLKKYHNKRVNPREFSVGDLVLRRVIPNTRKPSDGKLGPNWEGPYRVISVGANGSYKLETLEGVGIQRPWNTANLRRFYQ